MDTGKSVNDARSDIREHRNTEKQVSADIAEIRRQ
jgi:hypothetical protein